MDAERRKDLAEETYRKDCHPDTEAYRLHEWEPVEVPRCELRALLADSAHRDTLEATVEDWKQWHRQMSDALGCEYLERSVTLNAAHHAANEIKRLSEALDSVKTLRDVWRRCGWPQRADELDQALGQREDG